MIHSFPRILALVICTTSPLLLDASEPQPLHHPVQKWSRNISPMTDTTRNHFHVAVDGNIYVSGGNCAINIWNSDGDFINGINGTSLKVCKYGLAFSLEDEDSFFVQAGHLIGEDQTEIIAYHASDLSKKWLVSSRLEGLAEGTPIVSSDGDYTYFVTNAKNKTEARFIIVANNNGAVVASELYDPSPSRYVAYAPLGVGRNPARGNYVGGDNNQADMLVWGELYIEERGFENSDGTMMFEGNIHFFQQSQGNILNEKIITSERDISGKVTLSAPAVPLHGEGAYFSFNSGQIRGWPKGQYFSRKPLSKISLPKEFNNPIPGPNSGILAKNDSVYIFTGPPGPGSIPAIYAYSLNETSGDSKCSLMWSFPTLEIVDVTPLTAFKDDARTFFIDGTCIVCVCTVTGKEHWRYRDEVRIPVDFTVFEDKHLIYGTTAGDVVLLDIGVAPTIDQTKKQAASPSKQPTKNHTEIPTKDYTTEPTMESTNESLTNLEETVVSYENKNVIANSPDKSMSAKIFHGHSIFAIMNIASLISFFINSMV